MTFADFMVEFRRLWLDSNWEQRLGDTVLNARQGPGSFWDWQLGLQSKNYLLQNTSSHLDEGTLRRKLSSGANLALHDRMVKEKLNELPFKDWLERMKILDQARLK